MITLTKEWLMKTIAELEEERDATPGAVNEDAANALAAMKLALASLEAESVADVMADDLKDSSIISTPAYRDLGEAMERTVGDVVALFTAPPAPVTGHVLSRRWIAGVWWCCITAMSSASSCTKRRTTKPGPTSSPAIRATSFSGARSISRSRA